MDRLMPVHHFMNTYTVPAEFRDFFRSHQRFAYAALFQATSKTMTTLAAEPTCFSGDTPGFFGILHTWGRQMQYHPHIHYVFPEEPSHHQTTVSTLAHRRSSCRFESRR